MRHSVVLDRSVRVVFHAVLLSSLYLLFAGHNQPGGGFVGGLVAGAAVALRYVAGGIGEVRLVTRFRPWSILGTGLGLTALTMLVPIAFGRTIGEASVVTLEAAVIGKVKATTALPFDLGVYLLVVGVVFMVFEAFGDTPVEGPPP